MAKYQPRQKIDVAYKKGFPNADDFYKNFVERKSPVIFSNAVDNADFDFLKISNLNRSSRAAVSYADMSSFTSQDKERQNLW